MPALKFNHQLIAFNINYDAAAKLCMMNLITNDKNRGTVVFVAKRYVNQKFVEFLFVKFCFNCILIDRL